MKEYIEREAVLSAIWKTSAEHDLLKTDPVGADGKSRNTKKQRINGTSVNTVCIRNRVDEGGGENGTQDNDSFELPF